MAAELILVRPALEHLPGYIDALERGWSPDSSRAAEAAREELEKLRIDAAGHIERMVDREARGGPVTMPNGASVPRLPGYRHWLWDGGFCGSIGFRWVPGTTELPPYCLGHIGYSVVPWKRRRGYATEALRQLLPIVKEEGLPFVQVTTDPDNFPSQRVIIVNGGVLVERFTKSAEHGGTPALRFHIPLA